MVTTNYPDGVANTIYGALASYIALNPARAHEYFNDFDTYLASDWIVTETQAGATQLLVNEDGGVIQLLNTAGAADVNALQLSKETFKLATNKRAWFEVRFKVDVITLVALTAGLAITDATPVDPSDGVYLRKAAASAVLNLVIVKNGTETLVPLGTMVANTYVVAGWSYDPNNQTFSGYWNGDRVGSGGIANFPDDEELAVSFGETNGEAVAKTLSVDYIFAAKER